MGGRVMDFFGIKRSQRTGQFGGIFAQLLAILYKIHSRYKVTIGQ